MKRFAIIPARSGSKGVPDKNIKQLDGKPLMAYTIEAALKSKLFDEVYVSTDSEVYAEIARRWGASVPFLRNSELSTDSASTWDVVKDAVMRYREIGNSFDTLAVLQPTSPLRTAEDIIAGFDMMDSKDANAVVSVCETDHSPLWTNTLPEDASLEHFIDWARASKPRQCLPAYYRINGALYIAKADYVLRADSIYSDRCFALIMPRENSIDIDTDIDFIIAQCLIEKRNHNISGVLF